MESSTLFLGNAIIWSYMEFSLSVIFSHLYGHLGQFSHFLITFTQYELTMQPPSCQLTIEFIAMLNDKILRCLLPAGRPPDRY